MPNSPQAGSVQAIAIIKDDLTIDSASNRFAEWCGCNDASLRNRPISDFFKIGDAGDRANSLPFCPKRHPDVTLNGTFYPLSEGEKKGQLVLLLSRKESTDSAPANNVSPVSDAPVPLHSPLNSTADATSRLMRGLAHKMNNILTIFHGYSSLFLLDDSLRSDLRDGLEEIKKGADSASSLLERTVAIVRQSPIQLNAIPLEPLIKTIESLSAEYRKPDTQTELITEIANPFIKSDEAKLKTALLEIFKNAFEAVEENGFVRVRISKSEEHPHHISLSIKNNGPCIPTEMMDQIYEPFFTSKKSFGGLGLGLSVARSLIEQLGGTIQVLNHKDGVEVKVTLPSAS